VLAFVQGAGGGKARHKSRCPDLGVLVVELLLVPKQVCALGVVYGCVTSLADQATA
jgi:hypothetical protein